jgi:hypothetical protein
LTEGNGHREGTIVVAGQTFHWTTDIAAKVIGATEPPVGGITYLELGDNRSGTFNSGGVGFSVSNSKKTMLQACLDSIKTQIDASSWDATTKTNAHTVVDQLYNNPPASGAGTITTSGTIQTFDWSASSEFEVIPSGDINQPSQTYIAVEINIAGPQGAPTLAGSNGFVTQQTNNRPSMIPPPPGETQDGFYTNRNTAPSDTVIRQSALTKAVANLTNQINASALSSPQKTSALSALTAFQGMIPDLASAHVFTQGSFGTQKQDFMKTISQAGLAWQIELNTYVSEHSDYPDTHTLYLDVVVRVGLSITAVGETISGVQAALTLSGLYTVPNTVPPAQPPAPVIETAPPPQPTVTPPLQYPPDDGLRTAKAGYQQVEFFGFKPFEKVDEVVLDGAHLTVTPLPDDDGFGYTP